MKVTTLIADDEPVAREGLRDMLARVNWVECIGEVSDGEAAVENIAWRVAPPGWSSLPWLAPVT